MEHVTNTIMLLSAAAAGSLVSAIAEGIVLAIAVSLCLRLLPGIKPAARFIIWTAVLFAVLPLHVLPLIGSGSNTSAPIHTNAFHLDARWSLVIAFIWGILSLIRAAQLIRSAIDLRRIAAGATPIPTEPACSALLRNGRRSAQLCISTDVDRPSVVGFLRPRILLPPALLEKLSPQELEQILLHEMEHLRRRDDWTNLLQKVSLILFPLNPVLNWVERRLCIERELACDDRVLHLTKARKAYATCLTSLAEHSLLRRSATLALGAWEKKSELTRRVHRILRRPEHAMGRTPATLLTGTLIAGLLGGALTLAHTPQLVSFTPSIHTSVQSSAASTALISESVLHTQGFSHPQGFSPTLVKAVMPERQQNALTTKPRRQASQIRQSSQIKAVPKQLKPGPQNLIVLTGWEEVAPQPRLTLTVSDSTGSSYAAVPIGNGWLIIQL
jgi:beta-lactamase regulating signal transducer with metallopeptidase domain